MKQSVVILVDLRLLRFLLLLCVTGYLSLHTHAAHYHDMFYD
jgi:hypothetical protein